MDESEPQVEVYLRSSGHTDVVYEPDGNIPPDVLVNHSIAVEVRRLNQHHDDGSGPRGLEETSIPLWQMMSQMAEEAGPAIDGRSWYVTLSYSRPLPERKVLRAMIAGAFARVLEEAKKTRVDIEFSRRLKLRFARAGIGRASAFTMGGRVDHQSGGFILAEILQNLAICMKTRKRRSPK